MSSTQTRSLFDRLTAQAHDIGLVDKRFSIDAWEIARDGGYALWLKYEPKDGDDATTWSQFTISELYRPVPELVELIKQRLKSMSDALAELVDADPYDGTRGASDEPVP